MIEVLMLVLACGPLLLALWNLRLYQVPGAATQRSAISVLIPARNEARNIAHAAGCVLASVGVELELIVLDDGSTDGTSDILSTIADPRLHLAHAPALPPGWSGKQHACNELARLASHDLLVFVDADVRLAPDALLRMAGVMERQPKLGLASGFPRQLVATWSEVLLLPVIHFLLLGFLPIARMNRSYSPTLGAGCGQLFIARRASYRCAGGHEAIRASLHDGLTLPRAFRRAGQMTGLFDATGLATCRMYHNAGEVWEGLTKNATEGMARPLALPLWTIILGGGQVLPVLMMVVEPSILPTAAVVAVFWLRFILARRFKQPMLSVLLHPFSIVAVLTIQWAALIGAMYGRPAIWRGRAYQTQ